MRALIARVPPPLRAAALYAVGLGWTKGIALLLVPIMTALLTPAQFGLIEVLSSMAEIGALLAGAGLIDTLYRFAGTEPGGARAAAQVMGLALAISLTGAVLIALFAGPLASLIPAAATRTQVLLIGLSVTLEPLIGVPLAWLRMRGNAGRYTAVLVLRATLQTVLVAVLLKSGWGVTGVLAAGFVAASSTALWLGAGQWRATGIAVAPRAWGGLLWYGIPLVGAGFASFVLGTADRMLLSGHVTAADLGQYGLAAKFSMMAALLTQPFELWWYPRRLGLLAEPGGVERSARIVGTGMALVLLSAGGAAVAGPLLIAALTPVAYHPAMAFVPWLAAALALQSFGSLLSAGCYIGRSGSPSLVVNSIAAVVALAFYLLLIPRHGVTGAVVATVLAQAVRAVMFHVISSRRLQIPYPWRAIALVSGLTIAAAAVPQFMAPGWAALLVGAAGLAAVAGAAVLTGLAPITIGAWGQRSAAART
jgi:O-antigen/teichoic acid export membrane protein